MSTLTDMQRTVYVLISVSGEAYEEDIEVVDASPSLDAMTRLRWDLSTREDGGQYTYVVRAVTYIP